MRKKTISLQENSVTIVSVVSISKEQEKKGSVQGVITIKKNREHHGGDGGRKLNGQNSDSAPA